MKCRNRFPARSILVTLFALSVIFTLAQSHVTYAATINVGCDVNELITAINNANANADADILELSAGCEYTLTAVNNTDTTLGPNGLPIIISDITINGNGATIARASDAPSFRFLQVNSGISLTLNQLTLTGGNPGMDSNRNGEGGGAILNDGGTLTISHSSLSNNHSGDGGEHDGASGKNGGDGGAIDNTGTCTISNSTFESNSTGSGGGGGSGSHDWWIPGGNAGNGGAIFSSGACQLDKTTFQSNATGAGGWAVYGGNGGDGAAFYNAGTMTFDTCLFEQNITGVGGSGAGVGKSGSGGALFNSETANLEVSNCHIRNNRTANGFYGGGIGAGGHGGGIANFGNATVMATTFGGNITGNGGEAFEGGNGGDGGGIFNQGTIDVSGSTFDQNHTGDGGNCLAPNGNGGNGGAFRNNGVATITNSTFTANLTGNANTDCQGGDGGAIANGSSTLTLDNVTLQGNGIGTGTMNGVGGNLYNATGTVIVNNTIFTDALSGQNCSGTFVDGGGNLRYPKSDTSCVGIFANPVLGPLQDNGGATQTMALALDSPAINAANDPNCPTTDQRGIPRPQGKHCDSGAFELEAPSTPTLLSPTDNKKVTRSKVKLQWSAAERVLNYRVIVRIDSAKGKKIVNEKVVTTVFKTPALESGHWYFWRVKACSRVSCTVSTLWRFRVK